MFPTINYRRWGVATTTPHCATIKNLVTNVIKRNPGACSASLSTRDSPGARLRATSTSPKTFPRGPFLLEKPELHSDLFWTFCLVQSLLGQLLCSTCTSLASSLVTHDAMKYQALQNHSSTETLSEHWSYSRSAIFSTTRILQTSTNTIGTQCLSFTVRWMIDRGTPWPQLNFQISRVIIMTEVYVARFLKMAGSNEPFINRFNAASIVLHHIVSKELSFDDLKFKAEGERTVDRTYLKIEWNHFNRCLDLAANITHSSPFRFRTLLASQA